LQRKPLLRPSVTSQRSGSGEYGINKKRRLSASIKLVLPSTY
jgi:hypothetical protein